MILLHIISNDKKQARQIIGYLMEKSLILQASVSRKKFFEITNDSTETKGQTRALIICKTKALLFDPINKLLRKKFPEEMPLLYAVPIIYMDTEQTDWLRKNTAKV